MPTLTSVNVGAPTASAHTQPGVTGIDKRPVRDGVEVRDPGPKGTGGSGVAGDTVYDRRHHGGTYQAAYAYAREDLDRWEADLGRPLACGVFGENLTTSGLDVTDARIGEQWQIGERCVVQVASPRIPCRTFAGWLDVNGWVRRFTERGAPGAYLQIVTPGAVRAGDPIAVVTRPDHDVTIGLAFRALTTERQLLPRLLAAGGALPPDLRDSATRRAEPPA